MAKVADSSYAQVSATELAQQGYTGHIRYLSHEPAKNMSPAQIQDLHSLDLGAGLVWETTAARARAGYQAGADDAVEANRQADRLTWPVDRPIFYAVDVDLPPQPLQYVADYFAGVRDHSARPWGIYGEYDLIEAAAWAGETPWLWQCAAWSGLGSGSGGSIDGRRLSQHAKLFQTVGAELGGRIDRNVVLADDWGGWYPNWTGRDELEMASLDEVRKIVNQEVRAVLEAGAGRSVLATRVNSKGEGAIYELFLGSGLAVHLSPEGVRGANGVQVPDIGVKGPEVFDRFHPIEGHWAGEE